MFLSLLPFPILFDPPLSGFGYSKHFTQKMFTLKLLPFLILPVRSRDTASSISILMVGLVAQIEIDDAVEWSCGGHGQKHGQDHLHDRESINQLKEPISRPIGWPRTTNFSTYNCLHLGLSSSCSRRRSKTLSESDSPRELVL